MSAHDLSADYVIVGAGSSGAAVAARLSEDPEGATADVLALRLHALEVARSVLRTTQQLHGAAGVCDEYDVSVIARHLQPALRLPTSSERTVTLLAGAIAADGFAGLFDHQHTRALA